MLFKKYTILVVNSYYLFIIKFYLINNNQTIFCIIEKK